MGALRKSSKRIAVALLRRFTSRSPLSVWPRSDRERWFVLGGDPGLIESEHDHAVDDFHGKSGYRCRAGVARATYRAALQANPPVMQGASDHRSADDAIGEGPARVGTAIRDREKAIAGVENGQLQRSQLDRASL